MKIGPARERRRPYCCQSNCYLEGRPNPELEGTRDARRERSDTQAEFVGPLALSSAIYCTRVPAEESGQRTVGYAAWRIVVGLVENIEDLHQRLYLQPFLNPNYLGDPEVGRPEG